MIIDQQGWEATTSTLEQAFTEYEAAVREECARVIEKMQEHDYDEANFWLQPLLEDMANEIRNGKPGQRSS